MFKTPIVAALFAMAIAAPAAANPRPLPFTYPYSTVPEGKLEVEQFVDFTPVRIEREDDDGTRAVTGQRYELQTELEYGITDRLEAGFYFVFRQGANARTPSMRFQGVKQRVRYRFAEMGQWPVDVGVYVEVAEYHDEVEIEQKLLLSRRFGPVEAAVNLWVEQEYYFNDKDWKYIYNPTAGVTAELSPRVKVGLEYWGRGRFDEATADDEPAGLASRVRHYVGPTFLVQRGEHFLSLGTYARVDNVGKSTIVGDPFGRFWFRVLLGVGL